MGDRTADCGQTLTARAASIESLIAWVCDIDRGRWATTSRYATTPETRKTVVREIERHVALVPPGHCQSCGGPLDRHFWTRPVIAFGTGR